MRLLIGQDFPRKKVFIISGAAVFILLLVLMVVFLFFKADTIRRFNSLQAVQNNNTIFFDIDKQPFHIIRGIEDRKYVQLKTISRNIQMAVVAVEDARFFQHFGFDPIRIFSVILKNVINTGYVQGASTITQQLVKLTLLSSEQTYSRKIKEIFMSMALEMEFSKEQILEFYLNKVYLGHRNYGVENASLNYFHKSTNNLTVAESAFIAGLIKKPEGYSPFVNLKMARKRQLLVLRRLLTLKWISEQEYIDAVKEHLLIRERRKSELQTAPFFTSHIMLHLEKKYGHNMIYGGGLRIYTTLDTKMQHAMTHAISVRMSKSRSFEEIAGVSIDPTTGFVKALIGGADFYKSEFNRVTQAKRQPGSSFKPILYAAALSKGINPTDTYIDEPTQYTRVIEDELEVYEPGNSDNEHRGEITVAYALRTSNNVVSAKILNKIGINTLVRTSRLFGIELPADRGLCLALGCGETSLLQLVDAYTVFANQGYLNKPVFVLKITDAQGKVLEKYQNQKEIQVLSVNQAFQMNRMLQDVVNIGTGRNAKIGRVSGGKTGTSDLIRDAWFIGYTPELVTGFWIGNDDNRPMVNESGSRTPARLWRAYMNLLPATDVQKDFAINENYEEYLICDESGKLATSWCPQKAWYSIRKNNSPNEYCDIHFEEKTEITVQICTSSGKLATVYCPAEEIETKTFTTGHEPEASCDVHGENRGSVTSNPN